MSSLPANAQFLRKASLILKKGGQALDLSAFRFAFTTSQADLPSPSNCEIHVFNLSQDTMQQIQGEYSEVVVQAGYQNGNFGIIFRGDVRHYRISRPDGTTNQLDIMAADGERAFNNAMVQKSLAAGATVTDQIEAVREGFKSWGLDIGYNGIAPGDAIALGRGKTMFGLARTALTSITRANHATWSISDGKINILPLDGYLPGEVIKLNRDTGLIGRPEQMQEGIKVRCLLNPRIVPGRLIQIDQKSVNRTIVAGGNKLQLAYNSRTQPLYLPEVAMDGYYRVFVTEHFGDTRNPQPWYTELTCLAANAVTFKVKPYG